jgi:hypothetical protein|tara:strand:- start:376 stop:606 length:231 start_codon:yes stop_codon:yes gene_type:complete
MDKQMEKYLITVLVLLLLGIGLSGCGTKTVQINKVSPPTELETISKIPGIVNALGCMFDPSSCQAKKDLGKTEEDK